MLACSIFLLVFLTNSINGLPQLFLKLLFPDVYLLHPASSDLFFLSLLSWLVIPPLFKIFLIVRPTTYKVYDWEIYGTARIIPPLLF